MDTDLLWEGGIKVAFMQVEFFSDVLQMAVSADVILPQPVKNEIGLDSGVEKGEEYPVLWLLHGATDDHTTWQRRTSIERYAAPYGLAVVMPNAQLSSYTDMAHGGKFYTYISRELPQIMRTFFPISAKRQDNFIAGNSMGGYGAMKIGVTNPEKYAAIGCFSAGANHEKKIASSQVFDKKTEEKRQYLLYGGKEILGTIEDTWYMAEKNKKNKCLPRIFHTCGKQDFLLEEARKTRDFFESMEGNPYDYTYEEHEGIHDWEYWDLHITDFLRFINLNQ